MTPFTEAWNTFMALGTLAMLGLSLVLIYALVVKYDAFSRAVTRLTGNYILPIGLFFSLASLVSSLVYSSVIGFPPCTLCWYARVWMYPQVVLYGIALFKKDLGVLRYTLPLSLIGLGFTTYQYITETIGYSPIPCSAGGVSCLNRYVYEFGFISIPLMGLAGFLVLVLAILTARRAAKLEVIPTQN